MNVPNHEKKAFRDMTAEERSAIVEAWLSGGAEYYSQDGCEWREKVDSGLYSDTSYRTRPRQLVIPWEHIKPEYKWAAMDESGVVWMHKEEPGNRRRDDQCAGRSKRTYCAGGDRYGYVETWGIMKHYPPSGKGRENGRRTTNGI